MKIVVIVALFIFGFLAFVGLALGEPISITLGIGGASLILGIGSDVDA